MHNKNQTRASLLTMTLLLLLVPMFGCQAVTQAVSQLAATDEVVTTQASRSNDTGMTTKSSAELKRWLDHYAEDVLKNEPSAGFTVLVGRGNDVVFAKGYGYADLENNLPSKTNTVYQIGSLTKQFTAVAMLQLEQQGKLHLTDNINLYLPDYPTHGETITIADLLYHTSGIKNYIKVGYTESRMAPGRTVNEAEYRLELRPQEMTAFFRNEALEFTPGTHWHYSNAGYYLAGLIIENVSGVRYAEYVEKNLFAPANMDSARYSDPESIIPKRARGYKVKDGQLLNANPISMSVPFAAGALAATVTDLFQWNKALHSHQQLLNKPAYQALITPGKLQNGKTLPMNYALGLAANRRDGHMAIMHPGGINGFSSVLSYFPEQQLTVAVLTNTYNKKSRTLADQIEQSLSAYLLNSDTDKFNIR